MNQQIPSISDMHPAIISGSSSCNPGASMLSALNGVCIHVPCTNKWHPIICRSCISCRDTRQDNTSHPNRNRHHPLRYLSSLKVLGIWDKKDPVPALQHTLYPCSYIFFQCHLKPPILDNWYQAWLLHQNTQDFVRTQPSRRGEYKHSSSLGSTQGSVASHDELVNVYWPLLTIPLLLHSSIQQPPLSTFTSHIFYDAVGWWNGAKTSALPLNG